MGTNHKADSFDGGRAASLVTDPGPAASNRRQKTQSTLRTHAAPDADDAHALELAILSLEADNDEQAG
jgi:hypothetical protein